MPHPSAPGLVLSGLRESPLSLDEVVAAVRHDTCGALVLFVGLVRDHDHGRGVTDLDYSAHPSALERLHEVGAEVLARFPEVRLAAVHRVGRLAIGDPAVVVAAASAHRAQAFEAARDLIDTLKATVPIWKHQSFDDGHTEWVGLP
jgi:molybdopterin synthase catalytic subunit